MLNYTINDLKDIIYLLPKEKSKLINILINSVDEIRALNIKIICKNIINEIVNDICSNNPEKIFKKYSNYFKKYTDKIMSHEIIESVNSNNILYRARKGNERLQVRDNLTGQKFYIESPFSNDSIKAPKPGMNNGSRFNYSGTSYLYLSDSIETCLLEVQAEKGQCVSVGEFKPKSQLKLLNINKFELIGLGLWRDILLKPVLNGEEAYYNVCRFLNNVLVATFNCNGMIYKSSFSDDNNYVIYDVSKVSLIENSEKMYRITSFNIIIDEVKLPNYGDYDIISIE